MFFHLNVKMVEKYSHKTRQICSPAYIQFFDNIIFSVPIVAHNNTNTKIDMTYSDIQADSNHLLGKLFQSILDKRISHVYFRIYIIVGNNRYTEDDIVKKLNIGRRAYLSSFMRVLFNHFDIQMKKRIPLCVIFF
jgi:hypothetical protein